MYLLTEQKKKKINQYIWCANKEKILSSEKWRKMLTMTALAASVCSLRQCVYECTSMCVAANDWLNFILAAGKIFEMWT